MKMLGILAIGLACVVPQFSYAASQVTPTQLAGLTTALEYCERVDHRDIKPLEDQVDGMLKGMSPKIIEQARHSAEYQTARSTFDMVFAGLTTDYGVQLCHAAALQKPK